MKACGALGGVQLFLLMMCFAHMKMWTVFPMKMFSIFCQISSSSFKPKTKPKYSWRKEKKLISSKIAFVFFVLLQKAAAPARRFRWDLHTASLWQISSFILQISKNP